MQNSERVLTKILREVCEEQGVAVRAFSADWIFHLSRADTVRYVFGYDFDLNPCTAQLIAKDKSATSDILGLKQIPRVEHQLFHKPEMKAYIPHTGNWQAILAYAQGHGFDVVCKPNSGTGGADVLRARNVVDLEQVVHALFAKYRSICLSPFAAIEQEYRVIILRSECVLSYLKLRPSIIGDGVKTKCDLIADFIRSAQGSTVEWPLEKDEDDSGLTLNDVVPAGIRIHLSWRHNLGQGSTLRLVGPDTRSDLGLDQLALRAARAIGLQVGAVDLVQTTEGLQVLEINSGLMMERFARLAADGYRSAKWVYSRIISEMFALRTDSETNYRR
jgi:glutathione synthase/RimK-type ligase-like ATP-grasp enzyme